MNGYFVFLVDLCTQCALLQQTARTTIIIIPCILYTIIIIDQSVRVGLLLLIMLIRVQGGLSIIIYCLGVLGSQCYTRPRCWTVMY